MSTPAPTAPHPVIDALEIAFVIAGLFLLWREYLAPKVRASAKAALATWDIDLYHILFAIIRVAACALLLQLVAVTIAGKIAPGMSLTKGFGLIIAGGSFQLGLLLGVALAWYFLKRSTIPLAPWLEEDKPKPAPATTGPAVVAAGLRTFLIVLSVVQILSFSWGYLLEKFQVAPAEQEMVTLLRNSDSIWEHAAMLLLAVVVAPISEEALFRGGLFRYFRTRLSPLLAFAVPALLFSALHLNLQAFPSLFCFAILLSLAYQRHGNLRVTIIAHGLFNLHTFLLVYLGYSST